MLSYQHAYHAGGFADVVKHLVLTKVLSYMTLKNKPLFYLDTHAGRGRYDLNDHFARKTQEADQGIALLWNERTALPDIFADYMQIIQAWNQNDQLRYYPGSPAIAMACLRPIDRLYFCERHSGEFEHLQSFAHGNPRTYCSNEDGYSQLMALLPPPERRGIIMMDPSYEVKNEYRFIAQKLKTAYQHFGTGTYCIWYPIIDSKFHQQILRGFASLQAPKQLRAEFYMNSAKKSEGMWGCGMYIINPPFVLEEQIKHIFEYLLTIFNPKSSSYLLDTKMKMDSLKNF